MNGALIRQALDKASSLHVVLHSAIFAGEEAARQRLTEHSCALDSILGEAQVPLGSRGVLLVELPPLHIVRGPRSIRRRRFAVLDFEVAFLLGVFVERLAYTHVL